MIIQNIHQKMVFGKLWNEHLVQLQSEKYWFTLDPIIDLALGHDTNADFKYTFNNTRGFNVQGGLGSKLSFSSTLYESQGRFAQYVNDYAISISVDFMQLFLEVYI